MLGRIRPRLAVLAREQTVIVNSEVPKVSSRVSFLAKRQSSSSSRTDTLAQSRDADASERTSIYPASRASTRRNPHAAPLFRNFKDGVRTAGPSQSKGGAKPPSNLSLLLKSTTTDPVLKPLYQSLGRAADAYDAAQAVNICEAIAKHKQQVASEDGGRVTFEPREKTVFLALLRALGHHGHLQEVRAVLDDMLHCGFDLCLASLNSLLEAAVVSADVQAIDDALDRIAQLPSSSTRSSSSSLQSSDKLSDMVFTSGTEQLARQSTTFELAPEYTRNWDATTCAHLIESACQNHNLEYALAVLTTSHRLDESLPHESLIHVIGLCLHSQEFRLAIELADTIESGELAYANDSDLSCQDGSTDPRPLSETSSGRVARRLPPSLWISILRSCAEGGYMAGTELAWHRGVVQGLLVPDEGLILSVLALAAKEGSVQMAKVCLQQLDPSFDPENVSGLAATPTTSSPRPPQSLTASARMTSASVPFALQEWHLAPLFEAQCSSRDFEGALRTLCSFRHRALPISNRTTSRISTAIYPDSDALHKAYAALAKAATDPTFGTCIEAVNAVLNAAIWMGESTVAVDIYRAIPEWHAIAEGNEEVKFIQPDLHTFNTILNLCIDTSDRELGGEVLAHLNRLPLRPDATTYERMTLLCLTQNEYEDAFGFMEEAKSHNMVPSRKSYEGLIRKCFAAKDDRWKRVLEDMCEAGHNVSRRLQAELYSDSDGDGDGDGDGRFSHRYAPRLGAKETRPRRTAFLR
ncbi:hypothetical protein BCV70DRAFT_200742 [Testicularia cyperi]|uniref:Pentatricopeptide repeat-containing protein-mitochondrial domain-containing protein n=1 Tax=Testicularia cyperi TaxID=1882483 RepID=A0A317XP12_9BASI|nr:hypothetical protein BCV70DRAFT_200742 [Testicularia cyperi]